MQGCGGQYCIFKVQTSSHNPSYLSFESLFHPNQFMGILPTGEPKLASQTGRGPHGSFSPVFVEQVSATCSDSISLCQVKISVIQLMEMKRPEI